jgi:hypothetical protein
MDHREPRKGDWMMTFTGRKFWPLDPHESEVELLDIAWALAHQCRYNGHGRFFYSVAEHSVLMALHFGATQIGQCALLHDASEAYLGDCVRPLKRSLPQFAEIERAVEMAIERRFRVPPPSTVKDADNAILTDERNVLFDPAVCEAHGWSAGVPLGVKLRCWAPQRAFLEFLDVARAYGIGQ